MRTTYLWAVLACVACADTGGERVTAELFVRGTEPAALEVEDARFELTRAEIAVGPVYFCAAERADAELCERALAEFRSAAVIDALDPTPRRVGRVRGTSGEIRSAMYDYGIPWLLTQQAPLPLEDVSHSAILEGSVTRGEARVAFTAHVDITPRTRGALSVNGRGLRAELDETERVTIEVDPYPWLRAIHLDTLFALDDDGDGEVVIEPGTQPYEAILQGMQNRASPRFAFE